MCIYFGKRFRLGCEVIPLLFLFYSLSEPLFFVCILNVVLHELFHVFTALSLNRRITAAAVYMFGADISFSGAGDYLSNAFIAASGALGSIISGGIFLIAYRFFPSTYLYLTALFAILYGAFNLLPVAALDGGRCAASLLSFFLDIEIAERIMNVLSVTVLIPMWLFGVCLLFYTSFNFHLLIVSTYLFFDLVARQGP